MTHETTTPLAAAEVLARAKRFFQDRVPNNAAFPENEGPTWLVLRGREARIALATVRPGRDRSGRRCSSIRRWRGSSPPAASRGRMSTVPIRVMVEDAWDQVTLLALTTVWAKARALALTHTTGDPDEYQVKFRGAALFDEKQTLGDAGLVANAALIVLPRHRRPLR
jgi:hypothetical protein